MTDEYDPADDSMKSYYAAIEAKRQRGDTHCWESTPPADVRMAAPSARGLFRATGKKSKPVAARMLDGSLAKVENLEREKDDFYPTPPEPTRAFLHAEIDRLRQFDRIWEPACGDGAMVREMRAVGLDVAASDLVDRGCGAFICDFYAHLEAQAPSKAIVTNPPFSECNSRDGKGRWIWHAMDILRVEYMALLMNWSWPGAGGLGGLWEAYPPARVYLMRWKVDFTGQGAPPMLNGWFVWDKAHRGETVLRMLDRKDARQSELFSNSSQGPDLQATKAGAISSRAAPATNSTIEGEQTHLDRGTPAAPSMQGGQTNSEAA